jgi:hypothetical protein
LEMKCQDMSSITDWNDIAHRNVRAKDTAVN